VLSLTAVPGAVNLTKNLSAGLEGSGTSLGGALGQAGGGLTVEAALWTSSWSSLAGVVLAALGGWLGGSLPRPVIAAGAPSRDDRSMEASPAVTTTMAGDHVQRDPVEVVRTDVRR
jgi:hypothetical protein